MIHDEITLFEAQLTDKIYSQVKQNIDGFLSWTIYDILERPIQDIGLIRMQNEMKEKYEYILLFI